MAESPKEFRLETQKPEESHVEMLRREQTHVDIPVDVAKIATRKFDRHIIPWLFGIWCELRPKSLQYVSNNAAGSSLSLTEAISVMPKSTAWLRICT
jgi:hypothetical protein